MSHEVIEKITHRNPEERFVWLILKECNHLHGNEKCYNLKIIKQIRWITLT